MVLAMLSKAFPPRPFNSHFSQANLKARNNWIDQVSSGFFFLGLVGTLLIGFTRIDALGLWLIGLMLGNGLLLPIIWVCSATLPRGGFPRLQEFLHFYEHKYRIGMRGIMVVFGSLGIFGLISLIQILRISFGQIS